MPMLQQIAFRLAQKRFLHQSICPNINTIEEQTYFMELLLESVFTLSILLILSLFLHIFAETLVFILLFMWFRGNTGGYHSKTTIGCSFLSIIVALGAAYTAKFWIITDWAVPVILSFSFMIIFLFAPVNHPDLSLSVYEIKQCKKYTKRISAFIVSILTIMFVFKIGPTLIRSSALAILTISLSIVIAKILRQEVNVHETNEI